MLLGGGIVLDHGKRRTGKMRRVEAGEKKDKWWGRQKKGKYKTREKVEEVCTVHLYNVEILSTDSVIAIAVGRKVFKTFKLSSLIFALWQICSFNHIFVERAANGPSIHPWTLLTTSGIKIQFHSQQASSQLAEGIFCSACLINWQKKG